MARKLAILAVVITALALTTASVLGVAAKFHAVSSSINNDGSLTVSFDERGLGNGNIDYTLTADAEATWVCLNGGGKNPSAANKRDFNATLEAMGSFEAKNGRVIASISVGPPGPDDFSCPPGQRLRLASVSYTNIVLTDTTNGTSTSVPDASRVFIVV